jgi:hypothetical protein
MSHAHWWMLVANGKQGQSDLSSKRISPFIVSRGGGIHAVNKGDAAGAGDKPTCSPTPAHLASSSITSHWIRVLHHVHTVD